MKKRTCPLLGLFSLGVGLSAAEPIKIPAEFPATHPRIAIDPANSLAAVRARVQAEDAAKSALAQMKQRIAPYVERQQVDPSWAVSRLQMYWKSHATEVFLKGPFYDHAGGEPAPVPTVRFSGARDATTNYSAPALEEVQPNAEDPRGVYLINKITGKGEWVDPAKTGRALESINTSLMSMAESSAMVYWVTGDESYARFATDLFDAYMMGIYYRKLPYDLNHGHQQTIVGYTTFEVIQEGILGTLANTYDYLHDYLQARSPEKIPLYAATFKKWIDNTIANGVPFNNWDLIEARFVLSVARVLENDRDYPDGHGAQFYLDQIVNRSSLRQWSLFDLIERGFDARSAIWNECPGYSLGVVGDFAGLLTYFDETFQVDLLPHAPMIGRAVLASAEYLFPNGYVAAWGDSHYTRLSSAAARQLVWNAQRNPNREQEQLFTRFAKTIEALNRGSPRENRGRIEPPGFVARAELRLDGSIPGGDLAEFVSPTYYAAKASWFVQRNGMDPQHGLMISQNGSSGNHMHANGIAMELYGKGLVLGPASGIGTSYFQPDYAEYYSQFPAHNTVAVDGISSYPVMRSNHPFELLSCYPAPGVKSGHFDRVTFSDLSFVEPETQADQRRLMSIVRTSPTTGYYLDIFRSKRKSGGDKKHEYFYHNLGQELLLTDVAGNPLAVRPTERLAFADGDLFAYDYFWDKKSVRTDGDFRARFNLEIAGRESISMNLWMRGYPGREIFAIKAPRSRATDRGMVPPEIAELPLPTLVVQQSGEAWKRPFVAIFEPTSSTEPASIAHISSFVPEKAPADFVGVAIEGKANDRQLIFSTTEAADEIIHGDIHLRGTYAVVTERDGKLESLFLGNGRELSNAGYSIVVDAGKNTAAALSRTSAGWTFVSGSPATLILPRGLLRGKMAITFTLDGAPRRITGQESSHNGVPTLAFPLPVMPLTIFSW